MAVSHAPGDSPLKTLAGNVTIHCTEEMRGVTLYYQCKHYKRMAGKITMANPVPGLNIYQVFCLDACFFGTPFVTLLASEIVFVVFCCFLFVCSYLRGGKYAMRQVAPISGPVAENPDVVCQLGEYLQFQIDETTGAKWRSIE